MSINSKPTKVTSLIFIVAAIVLSVSAVSNHQVALSQEETPAALEEAQQKISELAKEFKNLVTSSGVNLTLTDIQNANITEVVQNLQNNPAFANLSEQFAQVSEQLGLQPTNLQNLQQGDEDVIEKLRALIANSTAN